MKTTPIDLALFLNLLFTKIFYTIIIFMVMMIILGSLYMIQKSYPNVTIHIDLWLTLVVILFLTTWLMLFGRCFYKAVFHPVRLVGYWFWCPGISVAAFCTLALLLEAHGQNSSPLETWIVSISGALASWILIRPFFLDKPDVWKD